MPFPPATRTPLEGGLASGQAGWTTADRRLAACVRCRSMWRAWPSIRRWPAGRAAAVAPAWRASRTAAAVATDNRRQRRPNAMVWQTAGDAAFYYRGRWAGGIFSCSVVWWWAAADASQAGLLHFINRTLFLPFSHAHRLSHRHHYTHRCGGILRHRSPRRHQVDQARCTAPPSWDQYRHPDSIHANA